MMDSTFFDDFEQMIVRVLALQRPVANLSHPTDHDPDREIEKILAPYHDAYWVLGQAFAFRADGFNPTHAEYLSDFENLFTDNQNSSKVSVFRAASERSIQEWNSILALTHECRKLITTVASQEAQLGQQMADLALRWIAIMVAVSDANSQVRNTLLDEAIDIYALEISTIQSSRPVGELTAFELNHYLEDAFSKLVGLAEVKDEIKRQVDFYIIQKLRSSEGLSAKQGNSRHLVFLGNPGTGKTIVARIIGSLYHKLGLLKTDKFIETSRQNLVAPFIGQTAIQTTAVIQSAIGGILFIDEAYTLSTSDASDYGREAIDTLLKSMEDHRDNLVVIVAGYNAEMDRFLDTNPGLASRFNRRIEFRDYSPPELLVIFDKLCAESHYKKSAAINPLLLILFERDKKASGTSFGNARYVRNLFESVIEHQARRLANTHNVSRDELQELLLLDFELALGEALPTPENNHDILSDALSRMQKLIGLNRVKGEIGRLVDFVQLRKTRKSVGLGYSLDFSQHLVFTGNPGTGKTTVARLLADLFFALEIVPTNRMLEVDRGQLVGGYLGETAIKTTEVIKRALGGVLFIDEAYTLSGSPDARSDYGQEAIDTLLKLMEDHRNEFVVVVAGYAKNMDAFLDTNPGLRSRFSRFIDFEDYKPIELLQIFEGLCSEASYSLAPLAKALLASEITRLHTAGLTCDNGRFCRNIFQKCVEFHSQRVAQINNPSIQDLTTLKPVDIRLT
jgi:SpoVK/Ycf46/Vps4 family AAA+-type ATPase